MKRFRFQISGYIETNAASAEEAKAAMTTSYGAPRSVHLRRRGHTVWMYTTVEGSVFVYAVPLLGQLEQVADDGISDEAVV